MDVSPDRLSDLVRAVRMRVPLDAAQLLARESAETVTAVLAELPQRLARDINSHLPASLRVADPLTTTTELEIPGTVAEMMEPVSGVLDESVTVEGAIAYLRAHAHPQQITYLYVNRDERLVGMVVIRDLLLAEPQQTLGSVMLPDPFALTAEMSAGEAIKAAVVRQYPVYPVVDEDGRIVGVVRGWLLFERQAIEITAQSGQMVGVDKEERVQTSLWAAFRMRHPWLQINLMTAFGTALIVGLFDHTIAQLVVLAAFLPVLSCLAGNNGCQALAITIRGLTLGDLDDYPVRRLILKEAKIGALNGLGTGLVAAIVMYLFATVGGSSHAAMLAVVMLLSMVGTCVASCVLGTMVPLALKRFGADPATASSIFVLTVTDILGMGMMLTLATVFIL